MQTWHIHIKGQVQGVGFRPFVYRLAKQHQLNGWVNNTTDGVHVEVNGIEKKVDFFYRSLLSQAPQLSRITDHHIFETSPEDYNGFEIIHSQAGETINLLLTPDFALCPDCRQDLFDQKNKRQNYPFTTCTYCGPRYSIIQKLPYDRPTTSMAPFQMCKHCLGEYQNPLDRRYFAQTNSCPHCSIPIQLYDNEQNLLSESFEDISRIVVQAWENGKIVAVKGIGGYLLCCSAHDTSVVELLRSRKNRPSKPFALMYPDVETLAKSTDLHEQAAKELLSPSAPIVLLTPLPNTSLASNIAPGLERIGVMLPYAPIFELLLKKYQAPIVATSGNPTESPIVYSDKKALSDLRLMADLILTNRREIVVPQDDSLIQFSPFSQQRIILRRSRGMAPTYIDGRLERPDYCLLATGAMLKSTFTFLHEKNLYVSQYLGNLANFETEESYRYTIRHFLQLFDTRPEYILGDLHQDYPSTQFALNLAKELDVPLELIQHHKAHFGALLGEHKLIHTQEPVLGVIWDGTGLGEDGHIWGGEFFIYSDHTFRRCIHFDYFDFILGDKMPREPRISALSACWGIEGVEVVLKQKFSETEWRIYHQLLAKGSSLKTSSLGRIFDAIASLLGLMDKQTYEGEAAMKLEALALSHFRIHDLSFVTSYFNDEGYEKQISTQSLMKEILMDLGQGKDKAFIAAKFHYSLVHLIEMAARQLNTRKIAFSGGVFQNGLLVDLIIHHLSQEFELLFHRQLSPNDESVSFGQLICHQIKKINGKLDKQSSFLFPDSSIS